MSGFIQGTAGIAATWRAAPVDAFPARKTWSWEWSIDSRQPWADGVLWPQSTAMGNNTGWLGCGTENPRFEAPPDEGGGQSMKKLRGTTRDSTGAVLGSAVVQGFRTSDKLFLRELTSDAGGYFELCSEHSGVDHFLRAYKAGSPDVAGTTVNTLQPS